jgi:hypothetical protein
VHTLVPNIDGNEIVTPIAPAPQDIVIYKQKPSGFFGSNMASYLTLLGCDSVIMTGTTTSGCVRATVLDAFSLNYRVAIAEEGCFDRSQASHAINLCDMNAKYADVVKTSEALTFLDGLKPGMLTFRRARRNGPRRTRKWRRAAEQPLILRPGRTPDELCGRAARAGERCLASATAQPSPILPGQADRSYIGTPPAAAMTIRPPLAAT